jgi:cytochrome b
MTRAWDLFVRAAHWGLATLVLVELLNEAGANPWHRYLGYAAAALVAGRLAWGLGDTGAARLKAMARSALRADTAPGGHTPLGALMAFTLWALVLAAGVTGWMLGLDAFWGEQWLQDLHAAIAYLLASLVVVHVGAAVLASRAQRVNLVKAMVTGEKPAVQR